jgi:16S rRNA (guanine527-N7)-methyltransferase
VLANTLARGLDKLGINLRPAAQQTLLDYLALLKRWNASYNLTAIRDEESMVVRHLLDSLSVLPFVVGEHCVDVGTGAGLPGLPLAVALPDTQFTLLDSNGKKTRFLTQAVATLNLDNVRVMQSRVEDYRPEPRFDVVLSRAFASLDDMIAGCHQLLCPNGLFLAMKGQLPEDELRDVEARVELLGVEILSVPGLAEDRCLVRMRSR